MKQYPDAIFFYSKFGLLNGPIIIGRIKIQTCQTPCYLSFDSFSEKMHTNSKGLQQNFDDFM